MLDTRFKLRVPYPLLARMQATVTHLGHGITLSDVACRCLRRWRRAGMSYTSGLAECEKRRLATRDDSVPISLEIPVELVFRLRPTEIRTAIRFALNEAEPRRRPVRPIEIDPKDVGVPYKSVEESE